MVIIYSMEKVKIQDHPVIGTYTQDIFDSPREAGYQDLNSKGEYGWQLPSDKATERALAPHNVKGQTILDVGCGWGNSTTKLALGNGAREVYAVDITPAHLNHLKNYNNKVRPIRVAPSWWNQMPAQHTNNIESILKPKSSQTPTEGTIGLMVMRHVLHFSNPRAMMNVLDLASSALKPGGLFVGINFSSRVKFMHNAGDDVHQKMLKDNEKYARNPSMQPGSYLDAHSSGITFAKLLRGLEGGFDKVAKQDYFGFDNEVLQGLMMAWERLRRPANLKIHESFLFSPSKIIRDYKDPSNQENHCFVLKKA